MQTAEQLLTASRVLLVEDDEDIREAITGVLRDEGYDVFTACNGEEALAIVRSGDELPHAILLDLGMPVMNGTQFCAALRDTRAANVPVVILSADGRVPERAAALEVAAYLCKPMNLDDLIGTVARICAAGATEQD